MANPTNQSTTVVSNLPSPPYNTQWCDKDGNLTRGARSWLDLMYNRIGGSSGDVIYTASDFSNADATTSNQLYAAFQAELDATNQIVFSINEQTQDTIQPWIDDTWANAAIQQVLSTPASQLVISPTSSNSNYYPILSSVTAGTLTPVDSLSLFYNPASGVLTSGAFTSTVAIGTPPLVVTSTTPVANLYAGLNAPLTTGTSILYGNGSGGFSLVSLGTGLSFTGGVLTNSAPSSGGTVTSASVATANGFSGSVALATTTPIITLNCTISGVLKANGTAVSAAVAGTDYSAGTSALSTGILKSTTTTGALTIAVAADFPTLNQSTTGNAATATTAGIVTTAAQPNITSVGSSLTVGSGASGSVFLPLVSSGGIANAAYNTGSSSTALNYIYASQPSNGSSSFNGYTTSALAVTGNPILVASTSGVAVTGTLSATGNITAPSFIGNASTATTAGIVTTPAQPNITSVGTLTGLTTSADVSIHGVTVGLGAGAISNNIALGVFALPNNTTGTATSAIGRSAGYSQTTGSYNTYVGQSSGYTTTPANANIAGSYNTWLGVNTGPGTTTQLSNSTAIGYGALNLNSNEMVLGNSSLTSVTTAAVSTAKSFTSTVATGTSPLIVTSTTPVTNLYAGLNAPLTTGSSILYGNGSGGFSLVSLGTGLSFTGGVLTNSAPSTGGTVTSVSGTGTVSGLTLTGTVTSTGSLTLGGTLSLTSGNITTGLGYTPYNSTNPAGYNTGTVTSASVATANGFSGSVALATTTPTITLNCTISGVLKANGTAVGAAVAGTDYSVGTSALSTGILKSTTTTGALTIAVAADFPILNQSTTGNAATATTAGIVTTAAQPNITSVGTLTSLAVTGGISSGSLTTGVATIGGTGLTINGTTTPLIVNSTTSSNIKLAFQEAGVNQGYIGAAPTMSIYAINKTNSAYTFNVDQSGNGTFGGAVTAYHLSGINAYTPTIVANAGAGISPTIAIVGNDIGFKITLTTGTVPTASSAICTVTFSASYGSVPYATFSPSNAAAALASASVYDTTSTSTFVLNSGATALIAATQYIWQVHVSQ